MRSRCARTEALEGLGRAHWWLGDPGSGVALCERAIERYATEGDVERAADLAVFLAGEYASLKSRIAARLVISPRTAEHHVRSVLAKLGLTKRAEAAAYAARQGLAGEGGPGSG